MTELLYISNARLPTEKAHGYQILQMCQAFQEHGLDVTLWHPDRTRLGLAEDSDELRKYYGLRQSVRSERLPCIDAIHFTGTRLAFAPAIQTAAFHLQTLTFALSVAKRLRKLPKTPLLYLRDPHLAFFLNRLLPARILRRAAFELHGLSEDPRKRHHQARLLRRFPAVFCLTEAMRTRLIAEGLPSDSMKIARDAVDLKSFDLNTTQGEARARLGIPASAQIAAYVGKFHQMGSEKGIPQILQSAPALVAEFPNLLFYFVGGPLDREPAYRRTIGELGLPQHRFVFLEKRPIEEVPWYLKASDVLLMPSPWTEQFAYYTSPLKLFEYMSSQRPIVATRLPSFQEVLRDGENALLAEPGDPVTLALRIGELLRAPELGRALAEQAYRDVQAHTWPTRAREILSFMESRMTTVDRSTSTSLQMNRPPEMTNS